ncbi:MAG: transposase [Candidatus Aminicenantes bacterium]|nr:transposase [Candidatus Aminicenantes bacterium]
MSKSRRKFSSEEKVRLIRRHLLDKVALSDLCDEYNLHPTQFYRWQKEFFEKGSLAFDRQPNSKNNKYQRRIASLEEKVSQKDEVIAEIMQAHVSLKKKLGRD